MGYYYRFKADDITLKKDTICPIIKCIEDHIDNVDRPMKLNHEFFKLKRHERIFIGGKYKTVGEYFKFSINCEINYGDEEIEKFVEFISPHVAGHKKRQYIGWYKGYGFHNRFNVYIERK
jgi:hypothetical protein